MSLKNILHSLYKIKVIRYAFIGGFVALADLIFFFVCAQLLAFSYLWVNAIGFIAGTLINYYLCILFIFKSGSRFQTRNEVIAIFFISGTALLLNQRIIFVLVEKVAFALMPAKILTVLAVFAWNYLGRKHLVFAENDERPESIS